MKPSMNEPENGLGVLCRCILLYADTSNSKVITMSSTRNHTFRSMELQNVLKVFVTPVLNIDCINVLIC